MSALSLRTRQRKAKKPINSRSCSAHDRGLSRSSCAGSTLSSCRDKIEKSNGTRVRPMVPPRQRRACPCCWQTHLAPRQRNDAHALLGELKVGVVVPLGARAGFQQRLDHLGAPCSAGTATIDARCSIGRLCAKRTKQEPTLCQHKHLRLFRRH